LQILEAQHSDGSAYNKRETEGFRKLALETNAVWPSIPLKKGRTYTIPRMPYVLPFLVQRYKKNTNLVQQDRDGHTTVAKRTRKTQTTVESTPNSKKPKTEHPSSEIKATPVFNPVCDAGDADGDVMSDLSVPTDLIPQPSGVVDENLRCLTNMATEGVRALEKVIAKVYLELSQAIIKSKGGKDYYMHTNRRDAYYRTFHLPADDTLSEEAALQLAREMVIPFLTDCETTIGVR
jgi:hypothetical protein